MGRGTSRRARLGLKGSPGEQPLRARDLLRRSMPTVRLTIDGMKCGGCAERVEEGVLGLEGVESVSADHEEGLAQVDVQAGTSDADQLERVVEELGYEVTGITPT